MPVCWACRKLARKRRSSIRSGWRFSSARRSPPSARSSPWCGVVVPLGGADDPQSPTATWCKTAHRRTRRLRMRCNLGRLLRSANAYSNREQMMTMDVGFIGLGTMGGRIAQNLLNAGYRLRVWNRSPAPVDALARLGARPVATAHEAFSGDAVFSMLADDDAVRAVIDGVFDGAPRGLVHVNLATISIPLARELAARHRAHGLSYVAA